jgi:nicotinamide mononucleotide transporter
MATKKLENWALWIIADVITVPLYAYRGLGILSLQYLIFTILAIQGYRAWKKSLNSIPQTL